MSKIEPAAPDLDPRALVRLSEARRLLGYGPTQLSLLVKQGLIPAPFSIIPGGRAKFWLRQDIVDRQNSRREAAQRAEMLKRRRS